MMSSQMLRMAQDEETIGNPWAFGAWSLTRSEPSNKKRESWVYGFSSAEHQNSVQYPAF